jgi:hypothetical protein
MLAQTGRMTIADIPLGSGLRLSVDLYIAAVRRGVGEAIARHGAPEDIRRRRDNAPPAAGHAIGVLNRLVRLLRFAFVILAAWIDPPPPPRARVDAAPAQPRMRGRRTAAFPLTSRPLRWPDDDPHRTDPIRSPARSATRRSRSPAASRRCRAPLPRP